MSPNEQNLLYLIIGGFSVWAVQWIFARFDSDTKENTVATKENTLQLKVVTTQLEQIQETIEEIPVLREKIEEVDKKVREDRARRKAREKYDS